jgi:hypothetical protein
VTRQANGRSTIYQGSDGYWHGRVIVGVTDEGKPDRRHVMSRSKSVVTARVRELEKRRENGSVPYPAFGGPSPAGLSIGSRTSLDRQSGRAAMTPTGLLSEFI